MRATRRKKPDETVTARVRVDEQGRVVVPAELRKTLGIVPGDELVARVDGATLRLQRRATAGQRLKALFEDVPEDRRLARELITERRAEAKRER